MNRIKKIGLCFFCMLWVTSSCVAQAGLGQVQITFQYTANGKPLVLGDSSYINSFNETYQVNRLKFYISNVELGAVASNASARKNIFLIDAAIDDTVRVPTTAGNFHELQFSIGVDSLQNVSGAQDGALDPLNGMYWTWHSGYIFFKLEGASPASTADLNRIEHHVGGYQGLNKAGRKVTLNLPGVLVVKPGKTYQVTIQVDLDKYWQSVHEIKIADMPTVMAPGVPAKKSADNIATIFSVLSIQ